jgi:nucleotide-binding universal stress UspA family protein
MYKKIIVALSLEHGYGERAIKTARKLKAENGKIIAVHVFEPVNSSVNVYLPKEHVKSVRKAAKEDIVKKIGTEKDVEAVVLTGHSGRAITDYAEEIGADCIVVGSHKPGLQDFFLGSTAARIVRHAPCSVHVLRQETLDS